MFNTLSRGGLRGSSGRSSIIKTKRCIRYFSNAKSSTRRYLCVIAITGTVALLATYGHVASAHEKQYVVVDISIFDQTEYAITSSKQNFVSSFAMGTVAAVIASTCVYPLDKIKTRIQSGGGGIISVLRTILTKEGPLYLYRGLSPQIAVIGPVNAAQLAANDLGHRFFRGENKNRELTLFETIISAMGAGLVEIGLCNPQEVVKIRMQMQGTQGVPMKSVTNVVRELGPSGLYKGVAACAIRDMPFNVIYFTVYEFLKRRLAPVDSQIGAQDFLLAGVAAGSISAALVTPADTIKTRLQNGQVDYRNMYHCLVDTYKNHGGGRALWRGTVPRVLIIGPMFGIQLMVFEMLQRYFFPS